MLSLPASWRSYAAKKGIKMKSKMDSRSCVGFFTTGIRRRVFACVLLCAIIPLYAAQANSICGKDEKIDVLGGEYRINNNVWNKDVPVGTQCLTLYPNATYFSVTTSTHNQPGAVVAYPFILRGRHWGIWPGTQYSGMPIKVSDVVTAPFVWSVDPNDASGKWNISYESWFSTYGGTSPDKAELMIWLNWHGGMVPGGSYQTTVSIGGASWDVYHASPWSTWLHYIVYRITTPTNYVNLDLKDFIDDSVSRGWISTSWYLDNMEAGFELMVSGQGLTSNSFSGLVNKVFSTAFTKYATFASQWGRTDCDGANNWCNGADYPPENGSVDLNDLEEFVNYWLAE
jgi:hypothetical protein